MFTSWLNKLRNSGGGSTGYENIKNTKRRTNEKGAEILGESNFDKLKSMGIVNKTLKEKMMNDIYGFNTFKMDFALIEALKKAYPALTMENILYLYHNKTINDISFEKIQKIKQLGIGCYTCEIFSENIDIDFNLLETLQNYGIHLHEVYILKHLKKIKKNRKRIQKNIETIKNELGIVPGNLEELADDFWSEKKLKLNVQALKKLQTSGRELSTSHLKWLNDKTIHLTRWELMKGRCDIRDMIKYNNMSEDEFYKAYELLQSENNKSV